MAKKKMTLEEKLEEAIVNDIPYEVPENWCWAKLDKICDLVTGNTPSKKISEYYGDYISFVKPNDLEQGRSLIEATEMLSSLGVEKARVLARGATAVCCIGSIGKTAYLDIEAATNQQITSIVAKEVNNLFVYYYALSNYFQTELVSRSSATTIAIINKAKMGEIPFVLPPLNEQQRIVEKIESLFEKLDKAKELIEEVKGDFESRKASITSKVFRGEYTVQEEGNGENRSIEGYYSLPKSWKWVELSDVCEKITDGTHKSPVSYPTGTYKYITAKNIKEYGIDLKNLTYLEEEAHREIYKRCDVVLGDVLYIKDGATTGIATINSLDEEFSLLSSVALIRCGKKLDNRYLCYLLNSFEMKKNILSEVKGVAITRLTLKKINKLIIPLPPIDEQRKIVEILDSILGSEVKVENLVKLEEQIELIKKSILAKAFRGELETNNPEEESAIELLKEILSEK